MMNVNIMMRGRLAAAKVVLLVLLGTTTCLLGISLVLIDGQVNLATARAGDVATVPTLPTVPPVPTLPPVAIYISSSSVGEIEGIPFDNEDILVYNWQTASWSVYFDGSACGLANVDVEAFDFTLPDQDGVSYPVMAFDVPVDIPGLGWVDDSDIVKYVGSCQFELFFDGSVYGLTRKSENINAISFMPDGRLVISTNGYTNVKGHATGTFKGRGQDLWIFDFATEKFTFYFDGSDVDLVKRAEIIDGLWIDKVPNHDPNLYLG
jgi:hypothetical protein